jgi:uncharacterized damage-inducible protein DinB
MDACPSFLEETLEAWRAVREGIVAEAENIPDKKYDFRPSPESRTVRELLQHILEVSMMMTGELTRPDTDLRRAPFPKLVKMYAGPAYEAKTKTELVALLKSQILDAARAFRRAGELALFQFMERFDGKQGTKFQWLHHGIAQEMYHRGQLALYARLMGLEPVLTQRIRSAPRGSGEHSAR